MEGKKMEAPAINELRQRKQKSEKENSFEREKEIYSNDRDQKETLSDSEREKEIPCGVAAKETPPDVERDKEIDSNEREKEISPNDKRGKDTPPDDDICPICFDDFKIPCQTNCGHWFCANCIIMFWSHGSKFLRCKCPICSQSISKLTPEASLTLSLDDEIVEALEKVQGYNRHFEGGVRCFILFLRQLLFYLRVIWAETNAPLHDNPPMDAIQLSKWIYHRILWLWRMFYIGLYDPDKLMFNYAIARTIALVMTEIYVSWDLDFIHGGILRVNCIFERCTLGPVVLLCAIGVYRRFVDNRRRPPRRRRRRPNPVPGPITHPIQGSSSPPLEGQVPPVPGP
ncbi:hypothetical protein RHSIM_Rhsim07G0166200 [Rhododendron simsii]|uniref:RING-type domain-containing protein n=1 Tax=Rhododendron simsii TaxID=118357 RepID=A0A834GZH6_RHOSS|nr:hypothetical protein RHSIM_Rhsim07G0166200 [Rhododendron simsii]